MTAQTKHTLAAALCACVFLAKVAFVAAVPLRCLAISPWLIDDTFITMRISRNLALGNGFSFDGINPTSGTPLVWAILAAPLHWFLDPSSAAKATMIASALLGSVASLLLFQIAARSFGLVAAWFTLALSLAMPILFWQSMNAMETSLFAVLCLAALSLHLRAATPLAHGTVGLIIGLATATRADALFFAAALAVVWMASSIYRRRPFVRELLCFCAGFAAVFAVTLAWNWHTTGGFAPANQIGRQALAREMFGQHQTPWQYIVTVHGMCHHLWGLLDVGCGSLYAVLAALIGGLFIASTRKLAAATLIYGTLFFGSLVTYQWFFYDAHGLRYIHLFVMLAALVAPPVILAAMRRFRYRAAVLALISIAAVSASSINYQRLVAGLTWLPDRRVIPTHNAATTDQYWSFIDWINANLPDGAPVAAMDHGRLSYFTNCRVVDMTGIIDPAILAATRNETASKFLADHDVQYVIMPRAGGYRAQELIRAGAFFMATTAPPQDGTGFLLFRVIR